MKKSEVDVGFGGKVKWFFWSRASPGVSIFAQDAVPDKRHCTI
jgi:hypothetical protein